MMTQNKMNNWKCKNCIPYFDEYLLSFFSISQFTLSTSKNNSLQLDLFDKKPHLTLENVH